MAALEEAAAAENDKNATYLNQWELETLPSAS
jgi:hypothetical protein